MKLRIYIPSRGRAHKQLTYRNLPDLMMALVWASDMAEVREIKASLEESRQVIERVEANVIVASRAVPSWADALIKDMSSPETV